MEESQENVQKPSDKKVQFNLTVDDMNLTRERSHSHQPSGSLNKEEKEEIFQAIERASGRERATSLLSGKDKYPSKWKQKNDFTPRKSSSTATLYVDSTISNPKQAELMRSLAEYFQSQIKVDLGQSDPNSHKALEIFDESIHPLTNEKHDLKNPPAIPVIEKFIKEVFRIGQLAPESLIMAVVYINRIQKASGFEFTPANWRRMLLAAMILASKVWEDQAVWNVDFIPLFNAATARDFAHLEKQMLALLAFDVSLKASEYSKIYFDIRAQSNTATEHFKELNPLDKEGAEKLELKIKSYQAGTNPNSKERKLSRGGSYDNLNGLKSPRVTVNGLN